MLIESVGLFGGRTGMPWAMSLGLALLLLIATDRGHASGGEVGPVIAPSRMSPAAAATEPGTREAWTWEDMAKSWLRDARNQGQVQSLLKLVLLGLGPALLLASTSFIRISIVLGLLRQAIGPSMFVTPQITTTLSFLLTFAVMTPVWHSAYQAASESYRRDPSPAGFDQAWREGIQPLRGFMIRQIEAAGNQADVILFVKHSNPERTAIESYDEVSLEALLPAFMLSELKTAFYMGFRIYLPFLAIDLIIAALTATLGMFMLPPSTIALPLKLIMFVLADGWHFVAESLLRSFQG